MSAAALCWRHVTDPNLRSVQGRQEDLRSVVTSLRATYGVDYIYCWHGLPAYWSGISLEVRHNCFPMLHTAMGMPITDSANLR